MNYTTVGELIEVLQQFPIDTPAVKYDPTGNGYFPIILTGKMQYRIVGGVDALGEPYYVDAPDNLSGFLAVAL